MINKSFFSFVSSASAIALISVFATPAVAQDSGEGLDSLPSDIVVTARRVEERLQDVPISITVFNQAQLDQRNIASAGELATYTPSLSANSRFGGENTSFSIRGFVQEAPTSPSVGVYFAEVVSARANGATTGGNGAGVGSLFDLQNVQVLKGPQGTLFGRNTTGGAVLLTPRKPTHNLEGYVEGTVGNYDLRRVQAVVNLPLADTFRVRLGVDRQKRDGFLKNVSGVGPKDFADIDYTAARLSIVGDLTPNLENYIIASYSTSDTNGSMPKMMSLRSANEYRGAQFSEQIASTSGNYYDVANGNPLAGQKVSQWQVINTTTWQASDAITLKNIVSYAEFRQRTNASIFGDAGLQLGTNPPVYHYTASTVFVGPNSHNLKQSTFTEELQLIGRAFDNKLTYQVGRYMEMSNPIGGGFQTTYSPQYLACTDVLAFQCTDVRGQMTANPAGGTREGSIGLISLSQSRYKFRNYGVYAQGTYDLTSQLSFTAGLRYTWDRTSGLGQSMRVNFPSANTPRFSCANPVGLVVGGTSAEILADPTRCNFVRESRSQKPTWQVNLDYKPIEDVMVYAKYARGYRQGSINVATYGLERWFPEKVDTYEIGAKTSFRGAISGTFNIAAFYNDFRDQQIQLSPIVCNTINPPQCPFVPAPTAGIANAGRSSIKGVEVDSSIMLFDGFRLDASYAYLETKLKSVSLPETPLGFISLRTPPIGGPLAFTPKHKATATAAYTLPLDESIGRITLSGTYVYQSRMFGSSVSSPAYQHIPSQELVNLNLSWDGIGGLPVDVAAFVTNLTKEKFWVATPGASFGFDSVVLNQPRMYGLRLKYRFGN